MKQQCEELRYVEVGTLLASDAEAHGYFGISAAVDGNRLVVGASCQDSPATDAGKVYIYEWNGSVYVEVAQLTASDAQASSYFGISVAIGGNRLVVGATGEDTAGVSAGKVYIYDWDTNTSTYVEVTQLTATDAGAYDWFGSSVALSSDGNRLVVGACGEDTAGVKAGKVYIYDWDTNTSTYVEVTQLTASDAGVWGYFGSSVALSGNSDRLVVGAAGETSAGVDTGKVYVYNWNGTAYIEVVQLTASDTPGYDLFGRYVAVDGNRLVVGAPRVDDNRSIVGAYLHDTTGSAAGKVYIYEWVGTAYVEVAQLTASDTHGYDWFGRSVALSGNRLVVGACGVRVPSLAEAGKVYIYDRNGTEEQ